MGKRGRDGVGGGRGERQRPIPPLLLSSAAAPHATAAKALAYLVLRVLWK